MFIFLILIPAAGGEDFLNRNAEQFFFHFQQFDAFGSTQPPHVGNQYAKGQAFFAELHCREQVVVLEQFEQGEDRFDDDFHIHVFLEDAVFDAPLGQVYQLLVGEVTGLAVRLVQQARVVVDDVAEEVGVDVVGAPHDLLVQVAHGLDGVFGRGDDLFVFLFNLRVVNRQAGLEQFRFVLEMRVYRPFGGMQFFDQAVERDRFHPVFDELLGGGFYDVFSGNHVFSLEISAW